MSAISTAGLRPPDRIGASRAGLAAPSGTAAARAPHGAAVDSAARVTLARTDAAAAAAVYADPRARAGVTRLWSAPPALDDAISALMSRNRGLGSYSLGDQWRGLGGALLSRFAQTGGDYAQTLAEALNVASDDGIDGLPPEERAQRAADILARQAAALAGVATGAPTVGLRVQTRSGQAVELTIAVSAGANGILGMKVAVTASGAMSAEERAAIGQLADGLNRALDGLGRDDAVGLDLSGLLGYDRGLLASVDLSVRNTQPHQALGSFSLHLGDDRQSVALKGSDGEMKLDVGKPLAAGGRAAPQRDAALQRTLERIDGAGERGHANAALVEQMKSAFMQLQAAAAPPDGAGEDAGDGEPATGPVAGAAAHWSGLADFEASLGGATWRRNRFGTTREAGEVAYQLSQTTTAKAAGSGGPSAQTVSERLAADFAQAPAGGMLDVSTGNHLATHVRDSSTVTTLIDSVAGQAPRVLRKTDVQQLRTVTDFENHHVARRRSWPSQHSLLERLR
jgi:hypothetical protein